MKERQRTVHDRVGAGIGMLVGALVALAPVVPASADVLRCSIPEASQGESAQLIIRDDLGAELRLAKGDRSLLCVLRSDRVRYCPECHVPHLTLVFGFRGECRGSTELAAGLGLDVEFRADLRAGALATPALSYRSRRIFDPCRLEEFRPEPLGLPSGLALAK
jgi:hypothetical protein